MKTFLSLTTLLLAALLCGCEYKDGYGRTSVDMKADKERASKYKQMQADRDSEIRALSPPKFRWSVGDDVKHRLHDVRGIVIKQEDVRVKEDGEYVVIDGSGGYSLDEIVDPNSTPLNRLYRVRFERIPAGDSCNIQIPTRDVHVLEIELEDWLPGTGREPTPSHEPDPTPPPPGSENDKQSMAGIVINADGSMTLYRAPAFGGPSARQLEKLQALQDILKTAGYKETPPADPPPPPPEDIQPSTEGDLQ